MVAFAETSCHARQAPARQCEGSSSCAPGKNPALRSDRNQQYSITALTNGSGTIVERYAYTAYGQPAFFDGSGTVISASAESNRYCYTGREWDEGLQLYHYRARMYDSLCGRFLSRDPIGFEGSPWGLYEYTSSNPPRAVDPYGLCGFDCDDPLTKCLSDNDKNLGDCKRRGVGYCSAVCKLKHPWSIWGQTPDYVKCYIACTVAYDASCHLEHGRGKNCCAEKATLCEESGEWPDDSIGWWLKGCPIRIGI